MSIKLSRRWAVWAAFSVASLGILPAQAQRTLQTTSLATASQAVEFEVYLPLQHADELDQLLEAQQTPGSAQYHQWLTPQQFRVRFGSSAQDIATLTETLKYHGLTVTKVHSHGVHVSGTARGVQSAFGVPLWNALTPSGRTKLVTQQPLTLPAALQNMGAQIASFSATRVARPHLSVREETGASPQNRLSANGPYWFDDIKQAYDFPSYQSLTGAGVTIAIMSVSDYQPSDINAYFAHESTSTAPIIAPKIVRFPVAGGTPFSASNGNAIECELDLEQAGGMAPGATLLLVNLPDAQDSSFLDGFFQIVELDAADIVSTSFGIPELIYTAAYNGGEDFTGLIKVFDDVFKQGNAQGITFVNSSGDQGALGIPSLSYFTTPPQKPAVVAGNYIASVDTWPASPHVTGVGGGDLFTTYNPPSLTSLYVSESAFATSNAPDDPFGTGSLASGGVFAAGGGKSVVFAKPGYQGLVTTHSKTRAVPDVGMFVGDGNFSTSVYEIFASKLYRVIGTSVAAPEFAGVLALKAQVEGTRLGNVNYELYSLAAQQPPSIWGSPFDFFHQGQPGFDGLYSATKSGYDFIYGVGSPLVRNFIYASQLPAAGDPQTPSNP